MRQVSLLASFAVLLALVAAAGCKSSQEGVKTNYRTQWTMVNADIESTTEAAREVLESQGLKQIDAKSTTLDGVASGEMADGTKVKVAIAKGKKAEQSEVSVTVGAMGDPKLGADITKRIKDRAEGR